MKKRLTRTEKWTQGKPEIPAYISVFLALNSSQAYYLRLIKRQSDFFDSVIPDIDRWHSYYEDFMILAEDSFAPLQKLLEKTDMPEQSNVITILQSLQTLQNPSEEIIHQFQESGEEMIRSFIPAASDFLRYFFLNDFIVDASKSESLVHHRDFFVNRGISFLSAVLLPCILEFQAMPQYLYKQAVNGNYDALEMLVKVDKNIITHPQIKPIWNKLASIPTNYNFRRIADAIRKKPTSKMNTQKVKITNIAMIEILFWLCNEEGWIEHKIHRAEIFELFDRVAGDLEGKSFDDDFAYTPEGRDRAVNREIKRLRKHFYTLEYFKKSE